MFEYFVFPGMQLPVTDNPVPNNPNPVNERSDREATEQLQLSSFSEVN